MLSDGAPFTHTARVLEAALARGAFPAAVIDVGSRSGSRWTRAWGRLGAGPETPAATPATIFDLASLTKVIATASLVMRLVDDGRLDLDAPVGTWLAGWRDERHAGVRLRHLLDHSSGLPAHARLFEHYRGRAAFEAAISAMPLEREPGTASVYSDPGFILLGFVLEDVYGAPLDRTFEALADRLALGPIRYRPPSAWRERIAPTEMDPWRGRTLVGEVHDENAAALDGVAGHAGLFGTAAAVAAFARVVIATFDEPTALGTPATMRRMAARTGVSGSSRALAWDTMLPTSSCGTRLSPTAIGHTGFTGTSLWIDWERDLYVVLLANRVHPTRANDLFTAVRPAVHDAVMADLEGPAPARG